MNVDVEDSPIVQAMSVLAAQNDCVLTKTTIRWNEKARMYVGTIEIEGPTEKKEAMAHAVNKYVNNLIAEQRKELEKEGG